MHEPDTDPLGSDGSEGAPTSQRQDARDCLVIALVLGLFVLAAVIAAVLGFAWVLSEM